MKVIIAGSREWTDQQKINDTMDLFVEKVGPIKLVIQGDCSGADLMGRFWAESRGIPVKDMPAKWGVIPDAGKVRNGEMAEIADACVLFHHNRTPGSKDMLAKAKKKKLLIWNIVNDTLTVISPQSELEL